MENRSALLQRNCLCFVSVHFNTIYSVSLNKISGNQFDSTRLFIRYDFWEVTSNDKRELNLNDIKEQIFYSLVQNTLSWYAKA